MQQVLAVWTGLDARRRAIVLMATVAMFAAVLAVSRIASTPGMSLLYAGLESGAAGDVVLALEQRAIAYDVRGDAIYVDRSERDQLRLTLASEGLPANGAAGYELLDGLTGFGTTSQMFDAAYWRAKEGELARTIIASPQFRAARVHVSNVSGQPFRREIQSTASVTVTPASGVVSPGNARALRFLIASAVAGMSPEQVTIIDGQSGQMINQDDTGTNAGSGGDRETLLRAAVERLLAARVGVGNAVVEVSVETNANSESIIERRFDPETRVAISTDSEERTTSAEDSGSGGVTVASNLPTGDGAEGGANSSSQNSETRERVNYEVSETQREVHIAPGAIRRLTMAVLVNGTTGVDDAGAPVFVPRSDAELAQLRELVASAVGYNEARGDVITLSSMEFEPLGDPGSAPPAGLAQSLNLDIMSIIQLTVLAIVALALGLFVVRPILMSAPRPPELPSPGPETQRMSAAEQRSAGARTLTGEIDDAEYLPANMPLVNDPNYSGDPTALPDLGAFSTNASAGSTDPVERLRSLIEERQGETIEILRSWMEDNEETA